MCWLHVGDSYVLLGPEVPRKDIPRGYPDKQEHDGIVYKGDTIAS